MHMLFLLWPGGREPTSEVTLRPFPPRSGMFRTVSIGNAVRIGSDLISEVRLACQGVYAA